MNRIPSVATYRVSVLDDDGRVTEVLQVPAPTRTLAILNARFDYPRTWGKALRVYRVRAPKICETSGPFHTVCLSHNLPTLDGYVCRIGRNAK